MTVHFYDAGQALSALVVLPDGRRVLVDAGENPERGACSECRAWHERLMGGLRRDVGAAPIDLLWITHPHSDHVGGAASILEQFDVRLMVDNGFDLDAAPVARARAAATARGVRALVVDDAQRAVPMDGSDLVTLSAVVPTPWPRSCRNANDCSIGLRIDYCRSSVLFVGDAEGGEEAKLDVRAPVTLLQVGHHGSDTSTLDAFVDRVRPSYAVISAARPGEGTNRTYCHPRASTLVRLTKALGGPGASQARAFDGTAKCTASATANWLDVPTSDRIWVTSRDGDVVLRTEGEGTFRRVDPLAP